MVHVLVQTNKFNLPIFGLINFRAFPVFSRYLFNIMLIKKKKEKEKGDPPSMIFWSHASHETTEHISDAVVIDISPVKNKLGN